MTDRARLMYDGIIPSDILGLRLGQPVFVWDTKGCPWEPEKEEWPGTKPRLSISFVQHIWLPWKPDGLPETGYVTKEAQKLYSYSLFHEEYGALLFHGRAMSKKHFLTAEDLIVYVDKIDHHLSNNELEILEDFEQNQLLLHRESVFETFERDYPKGHFAIDLVELQSKVPTHRIGDPFAGDDGVESMIAKINMYVRRCGDVTFSYRTEHQCETKRRRLEKVAQQSRKWS